MPVNERYVAEMQIWLESQRLSVEGHKLDIASLSKMIEINQSQLGLLKELERMSSLKLEIGEQELSNHLKENGIELNK